MKHQRIVDFLAPPSRTFRNLLIECLEVGWKQERSSATLGGVLRVSGTLNAPVPHQPNLAECVVLNVLNLDGNTHQS